MTMTPAINVPNLNLTTDGLTTSKCSIDAGGYCKYGNMVIVNLRIKITEAISAGTETIISGLPQSIANGNNVSFSTNRTDAITVAQLNGTTLQLGIAINLPINSILFINSTYLCR